MIPRFLFRGWRPTSGGNSALNTTSAVTPHAFYGTDKEPQDKSIFEIPTRQIKSDIQKHLGGQLGKSHFSSWAANLQTALDFAGPGKDAHVSVFDTSLCGKNNEVLHVPALHEMGLTHFDIPEEYLVYGPVAGEAYTCVSIMHLREQGMRISAASHKRKSEVTKKDLTHARNIANSFRPISHERGPDLFLTVFAAELSRLFYPDRGYDYSSGWSQNDNRAIMEHLSDAVGLPAKLSLKKPLVNPKTYVDGFSQLKLMVDILMTVELRIDREKSELSNRSSPTTNLSPPPGQKRKADDSQVSNDSKLVGDKLQEAFPLNLLEDLVERGVTFREWLHISRDRLSSTGAKAQALKTKLVAAEKRLEALSIDPKKNTLGTAILHMEKAASDLDGLVKKSQALTGGLQLAEASLDVLQQYCTETINLLDKEENPFARPCSQALCHESKLSRPSIPWEAKAVAQQGCNSQKRTKLARPGSYMWGWPLPKSL